MEKDNSVYLKHILDAIKRVEEYTKNCSKEKFSRNKHDSSSSDS